MILPEVPALPPGRDVAVRVMKFVAVVSSLSALLALALAALNGRSPSVGLVQGVHVLTACSVVLGAAALVSGFWHIQRSRPDLRRPAFFLVIVTVGVLLAHLYVVNAPATATGGTVSGTLGQSFGDTHVLVSSKVTGNELSVSITNVGSDSNSSYNAIGGISLSLGGTALPAANLNPDPSYTAPLQPQSIASLGYQTDTTGQWQINSSSGSVLTVNYKYLTCYHVPSVSDPRGVFGCIMDEVYYVPSALGILSGEQCQPYADSCNLEHPPLAKALIAAGIAAFGLNDVGYRISEVIIGTLTVPLIFVLLEALGAERRLSYLATLIFAADPMFFAHSSAALIDVPAIFFSLLGVIFYFRRVRLWKINNYIASGVFFGLAILSKETAVFALMAVLTYELLFGDSRRSSLLRPLQVVVPAVLVFAGGVQLFDSLFTSSALPWFYQQVQFMLTYGAGLKGGGWCLFGSVCPKGPFITPLNWLTFSTPVSYLVVAATSAAGTYVTVGYYGVANPAIVWMVYLWLPVALYPLLKGRQWRGALGADRRPSAFLVVWFLWSYVPYLALYAYGRVTYPFYILPAMPALAAGAAYFLTRPFFPWKMAIIYTIAVFGIFLLYFPVKDFLPIWVRILLGH